MILTNSTHLSHFFLIFHNHFRTTVKEAILNTTYLPDMEAYLFLTDNANTGIWNALAQHSLILDTVEDDNLTATSRMIGELYF